MPGSTKPLPEPVLNDHPYGGSVTFTPEGSSIESAPDMNHQHVSEKKQTYRQVSNIRRTLIGN